MPKPSCDICGGKMILILSEWDETGRVRTQYYECPTCDGEVE